MQLVIKGSYFGAANKFQKSTQAIKQAFKQTFKHTLKQQSAGNGI